MAENKITSSILIFFVLATGLFLANREPEKIFAQESDDAKAFKIIKGKMMNPRTGLPKTLDPNLIKGKDRQGYRVAREIPEVLAQLPCFCGCEGVGHENLLDCFVDEHAVG